MPKRRDLKKILVIGAGPIIIGQACEFDYSGTQACKALRDEGYKVIWDYKGDYSFESGEKAFHNIYKKRSKNIAIFASNDQMAVGFIHAALENNQQIPKDYAIIGYDNILFSKIFFPKLTTIDTDVDQLAEEAIDHLIRMIKNEVNLDRSARKTLIPVKLIKRDTHK